MTIRCGSSVALALSLAACGSFGAAPAPSADAGTTQTTGSGSELQRKSTATVFVVQGQSVSIPVTLAQHADTLTLSVSNLPSGLTVSPVVVPSGVNEATLMLRAASSAVQGPVELTISARKEGDASSRASLPVKVFVRGTPGAVDTTFGNEGLVRHVFGGGKNAAALDLVRMPDDQLVVLANCATGTCLARISADGVVDPTYTGTIEVRVPGQAGVDAQGRVVISGNGGAYSLMAGRLTKDGKADPTFGDIGSPMTGTFIRGTTDGPPEGEPTLVAVRPDGSFVIGFNHARSGAFGLLFRDAKGQPMAVGDDGIVRAPHPLYAPSIGVRPNGDVWGAWIGTDNECQLRQWSAATGEDDPAVTPTTNGIVCEAGQGNKNGAALLPDGSIVAAFQTATKIEIAKWVPDGTKGDGTWGQRGLARIDENALPTVSVDPLGRVWLGLKREGVLRFMRLRENGSPDSTFGVNGVVVHAFGAKQSTVRIQAQKDGRIVVLGSEEFGDGVDVSLSRYWP